MEQRTVNLVKILPALDITGCCTAVISQKLTHLCLIHSDKHARVYSVSNKRENEPSLTLIWKSPWKVDSCKFSEDGKQLFTILETKCFLIYNILDAVVEFLVEEDTIMLSALLERNGIEIAEPTELRTVVFSKTQLIVLVEHKWLVSFWIQYPTPLSVRSVTEISSCRAVASSREYIYFLTTGGNLSAYSILSGKQIGVVNLYSLLPYGQGSEAVEVFSGMTVSESGELVAVSDVTGKVFVARVQEYFNTVGQEEERWNCGDSIISASSGTSHASVRTISSLLRIQPTSSMGDSASIYMFELTDKHKFHSYKTTWDSYLESLKQDKNGENVTVIDSRGHTSQNLRRTDQSGLVFVSEPPEGFNVQGLHMTAAGLAVWYTAPGCTLGGIYKLYDMVSGACLAEQFIPNDTIVIMGGCLGLMDAFLSPTCLWLFLGNLSRDVLVNKLLHCVKTDSIDRLLRVGDWRDLAVPLPALADGLKEHQMDVVRLALSLHSQAFRSSFTRNPGDSDVMWQTQLHNISSNMDKLFDTVHSSLLESHHKLAFSEQLVLLYLDHANDLLQFLHESYSTESVPHSGMLQDIFEQKKCMIVKQIMFHVVQLRSHLKKHFRGNGVAVNVFQPLSCLDNVMKKELNKWQNMEDEDVIYDAVVNNNIPLVQTFLATCRGWSSISMLQRIKQQVYVWLQQFLKHDIEKSKQILINLGCVPHEELRDICLKSFDKELRDNLGVYLSEKNLLCPDELEAWDMLKLIETILQSKPVQNISFSVRAAPSYQRHVVEPCDMPEMSEITDKLSINTITQQTREWRHMVLVELYFNTLDERLETFIEPDVTWKYLLCNNREDMLITWINAYYSKFERSTDIVARISDQTCTFQQPDTEDAEEIKIQRLFSLLDVTQSMIDNIYDVCCMTRTKEIVLDHLSRFGVFSSNEKANPCSILTRFFRTKSVNDMVQILNQPLANISYCEFEDLFIKFCIKHKLFNVVFPCFQNSDFSSDRIESLSHLSLNRHDENDWFRLWLILKQLGGNLSDESIVYQAVVSATEFLSKGDVDTYLQEHPLVVLATAIYGNKMLKDVIENKVPEDFPVSSDSLQAAQRHLPLLKMAVSSQLGDHKTVPDVTLYQLLYGCSPFDVSKLFSWQSMHKVKGEEFPHFSSEKLSAKFGHNVSLSYLYYLKQGRPSFAVNMFIIDQLRLHKKVSRKMKKQACNFAHGLALQNFTNQCIISACISFIEMLGVDSENVRVHVAAANKILHHHNSSVYHGTGEEQLHEEQVGMLLHGLIVSKEQTAKEILLLLEAALCYSHSPSNSIVKQLLHWNLAVKFAKFHQLKLPEEFLKHCAKEDLWLPFVLFIQLHQYPVDQVLLLVKEFHSSQLREHLSHALSHKMAVRQEHVVTKDRSKLVARDSRKVLYSRIGFQKAAASSESSGELLGQTTESTAYVSSSSSDDSYHSGLNVVNTLEVTSFDETSDIFHVLLSCHRSQDPSHALLTACQTYNNPVFAVLATCYEPSSVLACFCTWLVTSLDSCISPDLKLELNNSALQHHIWSQQQVETLLEEAVSIGHVTTLARGFSLFLPDNPLCAFTEFLMECVAMKNFKKSRKSLETFKAAQFNMKPSIISCEDLEGMFLNSGHWVASVAVSMACIALGKCFISSHHQLLFINTLHETSFAENLPVNVPDFHLLAQLAECLSGSGLCADWAALCCSKSCAEYQAELQHCIDQLVENGRYQQGLEFVTLAGLPKDSVIIAQWTNEFKNVNQVLSNQVEPDYTTFWYRCHEAFLEAGVNPKLAAEFFKEHSEKLSSNEERYQVLKMALTWLREFQESEDTLNGMNFEEDIIEMEMWKCLLKVDTLVEETLLQYLPNAVTSKLLCSLKRELQKIPRIPYEALTEEPQITRLNMLIGRLLDQSDVTTASRLEVMFSHHNQDLQLLWTCMSLAEGEITPYQLSAEHRMLLSEPASLSTGTYKRRTLQSVRLTSVSSSGIGTPGLSQSPHNQSISSEYLETNVQDKQDTLSVLEKLVERLQHGRKVGTRLVCCYRVALNLDRSYQDILKMEDPLSLLGTVLADDSCSKFLVASDLMLAAQMNSEEVSSFLCQEIVSSVRNHMQGEVSVLSGVTVWGCDLDLNFHLVLELCDDLTSLGTKLLAEATQLGASHLKANKEVVEILIRAHDCYTAALNMEGIAAVLHYAHVLTTNLLQRQEWALMVRLLTGVGRYTEMTYIFQMLKDNEQFEFLLGKGLDKVPNLKLAVLDYLKQHCREDRELFRLVALHFSMFSEAADFWESEGHSKVHTLLAVMAQQGTAPILLTNTEDTKQCLHIAMLSFTHAAEYFLRADKLTRAMIAAHHAELVALQTSLVNSVPHGQGADCLLELNSAEVANIITHKLSFPQARIVTQAYRHPVDWGAALYEHCIVQGDVSYLTDFTYNMPLTSALVEDVARRFQLEADITKEMAEHMKIFVLGISDVEVKYRVASHMGFRDVIESLLNGPELPYLKDTVWQSGFSRQHNFLQ